MVSYVTACPTCFVGQANTHIRFAGVSVTHCVRPKSLKSEELQKPCLILGQGTEVGIGIVIKSREYYLII